MKMNQGDTFILESDELAMLLQARGICRFQGFPLEKIPRTKEEILLVTKKLTDKGFLVSDGIDFHIDSEISVCITLFEQSQGLLLLNPYTEAIPQSFLYPGRQIVVCQPVPFKKGAVKIRRISWKELSEFAKEQGHRSNWQYYGKEEPQALWSMRFVLFANGKVEIGNQWETREISVQQLEDFLKSLIFNVQDKE